MKKALSLTAALLAVLMLATSCANNQNNNNNTDTSTGEPSVTTAPADDTTAPAGDTIEGDPLELLNTLVTDAKIELMTENMELAADETLTYLLGLTPEDFTADVEKGAVSMAMISSQAHMVALLKCNDAAAAQTVKEKLQKQFDIRRWLCVTPEMCYAINSGSYVFFVASTVDYGEALLEGFTALAKDNVGERLDVEGATGRVEYNADVVDPLG